MTRLLASVTSVAEARLAEACGADWIDVKDPLAGALGAAHPDVVTAVVAAVGGRLPVSATTGDHWFDAAATYASAAALAACKVPYLKLGLAARAPSPVWLRTLRACVALPARVIVVCMAEAAPVPADVARLARTGIAGIMLDTADKSGCRLTEIVTPQALAAFAEAARAAALLCGLAGRLRLDDLQPLLRVGADYLGFRSALCAAGDRRGPLDAGALRTLRAEFTCAVRASTITSEVT